MVVVVVAVVVQVMLVVLVVVVLENDPLILIAIKRTWESDLNKTQRSSKK